MKKIIALLIVAFLFSCNDDDVQQEMVNIAIPELQSKSEFRASIDISTPQPIEQAGKIYVYENYIFVNDAFKGIHVIDNSNPASPQSLAYLKIPGNEDISIKNDYLYADSSIDLVVFDISDINNIQFVERLEDVFSVYDYQIPASTEYADFNYEDLEDNVIVGWTVEQRIKEDENIDIFIDTFDTASESGNSVGTGGSLARFQIVNDFLYTVGNYEMSIFNISDLAQPTLTNTQYAGWNIETMFQADNHLYLGGTNGMYIYSLENAESPSYVSEFTHWEGCDPVVVDGDYAYLTLRGGNDCGVEESVLEVIDISDKSQPTLIATYSLDNPYGLGFKGENLFVCDGTSGLKVFDKTNPLDIQLMQTFSNIEALDVIPLNESLLMIGDNIIYQYEYANGSIELISTFNLN
ncbi:LVIVD repeat-containing protein [Winogradskyella sp. A3E31]|uniref:LVIVD repeat-containing protein n=1 Tax=Winogradskyella sp. A3E31 TaxID=3349637 RepID=UPI00398B64E2